MKFSNFVATTLKKLAVVCSRRQSVAKQGPDLRNIVHVTYEARIQLWDATRQVWVTKARESTFFPRSWSKARIEYEVSEAFKGKVMLDASKWQGISPSGLILEGFVTPHRTTFYPLM